MRHGIFALLMAAVVLIGCNPNEVVSGLEENSLSSQVEVTKVVEGVRVTAVSTPTFDYLPEELQPVELVPDYVSCGNFEGIEEKRYWVDDLIPGEITYDEIRDIVEGLPEEEKPIMGSSAISSQNDEEFYFRLFFSEGLLFSKWEPRSKLGEIISHYGHPSQFTWTEYSRSLKRYGKRLSVDTEPADTTVLFFPQSNAMFTGSGIITYFGPETTFRGDIMAPVFYDEGYTFYMNEVSSSRKRVQHFSWPC